MKINNKKKHYADKLVTPSYLFQIAQQIWNVKCNIDVAADIHNRKCFRFISREKDYLKQFNFNKKDVLWCNFPHSKQKEFVIHTVKVCKKNKCRAVLLLPINVLTSAYAKKYLLPVIKFEKKMIIQGRHKFLTPISLKQSNDPSVNGYVSCYIPNRRSKK
jgi:phage N-6-adenine-methyltransferase